MTAMPPEAVEVLEEGVLCYLAARTPSGPHLTPVTFVLDGGRLWATTARRTVKVAAWREDPRAGGLVRHGGRAVTVRGTADLYDALDPFTWPGSVLRAPRLARASARFTAKNARFFAGYARDARRVPFGWSPPGRVVVSVDPDAGAVLEDGVPAQTWGRWTPRADSLPDFRPARARSGIEARLPEQVRELLEDPGDGVLAVSGRDGPVVLPVRWARADGGYLAILSREALALAAPEPAAPAALVVDRASSWRAARMVGVLLRGRGEVFVPASVDGGRAALLSRAGDVPDDPAVVRLRPRSAVWWTGWTTGTVRPR